MDNPLYSAIFRIASVLEIPVVVAALLALALVVVELGRFAVEFAARTRRRPGPARAAALERVARVARTAAVGDDGAAAAARTLATVSWSAAMTATYEQIVRHPGDENAVAKDLADFDLDAQRRLGRTRLLVRLGPALGLMGTLIPLAPALDGLARGNTRALTDNLQVAFSITVLGLLIGAVAFGLSLVRETMYGQDFSDVEYVVAVYTGGVPVEAAA